MAMLRRDQQFYSQILSFNGDSEGIKDEDSETEYFDFILWVKFKVSLVKMSTMKILKFHPLHLSWAQKAQR